MLAARREDQLNETLKLMTAAQQGSCVIKADLSKHEEVISLFDQIKTKFGKSFETTQKLMIRKVGFGV